MSGRQDRHKRIVEEAVKVANEAKVKKKGKLPK